MKTAASSLGTKVHVYREKDILLLLVLLANNLPLRSQRFAACRPCLVGRINTSRVVLKCRAVQDGVSIKTATRIRFVQSNQRRFVKIGRSNVATWLTAVLIVDRHNIGKSVVWTAGRGNGSGQCGKREVC